MEIASGMHRIACRFADRRMAYVHLLVSTQAARLMDTGCAHNPPQALLLCHNLDWPWVEDTQALTAGRFMQFDADYGFATSDTDKQTFRELTLSHPMDMTVEGGEQLRLSPDWDVELVHTPGHTWGHLALYDPRSKTLAVTDHLVEWSLA